MKENTLNLQQLQDEPKTQKLFPLVKESEEEFEALQKQKEESLKNIQKYP